MWDGMRSLFWVNHDSTFIKDLVTWRHYKIILENSDIITCKDQRENVNIYYCWLVLLEWISNSIKDKAWNVGHFEQNNSDKFTRKFFSSFKRFWSQGLHQCFILTNLLQGSSWSWSYGSWIYNYLCNQCLSPLTLWVRILLRQGVLDTTLCDKVCQWLAAGLWFSPGTPVFSTNKTDRQDITEILLKVALNTITLPYQTSYMMSQM